MTLVSAQSVSIVLPVLAYVALGVAILGFQLKVQQPSKKLVPARIRSRRSVRSDGRS